LFTSFKLILRTDQCTEPKRTNLIAPAVGPPPRLPRQR
jgi:hypothetical protein